MTILTKWHEEIFTFDLRSRALGRSCSVRECAVKHSRTYEAPVWPGQATLRNMGLDIQHRSTLGFVEQMSSERPTQPEAAAFYYAVICGFWRLVEHLVVSCPCDINAKGGTHTTPLHAALAKGHFDIALLLLERGAKVNALDDQVMSLLHGASQRGRRDIVECFIDARIQNENEEIPMDVASRTEELRAAQVSRRYGVAVDSRRGCTLLQSASRSGHLDIEGLLLQNGAAVDLRDKEGWTPL
jgi:hypothetical protein